MDDFDFDAFEAITAPPKSRKTVSPAAADAQFGEPVFYPDENEVDFAALKSALIADLAPKALFEKLIANDLVRLEWDLQRYRRIRDRHVQCVTRELIFGLDLLGALRLENSGSLALSPADTVDLGGAVGAKYSRELVQEILDHNGYSLGEIVAKAHRQAAPEIDFFDRKIAEGETRRRRLLDDYRRLRSARATPVTEAEIIDA